MCVCVLGPQELIAAKLGLAQMSSELSALQAANKRLSREAADAAARPKSWFGK